MTISIVTTPPEAGSAEWLSLITASKVPVILGLSRWNSPYALWHEMKGLIDRNHMDPVRAQWGHRAENALAGHWVDMRATAGETWELNPGGELTYTRDDLGYPTKVKLDRRAFRRTGKRGEHFHIVECKTANTLADWGKPGDGNSVPADYYAQVLYQMGVSGIHRASIIVAAGFGAVPEIHEVEWDEELFGAIVEKCQAWHESLKSDTPPPLDDTTATYNAVRGLHPDIEPGTEVELPQADAVAFVTAMLEKKQADKAAQAQKTALLAAMESANYAVCDGVKIATRFATRGAVALKPNKQAHDLLGGVS